MALITPRTTEKKRKVSPLLSALASIGIVMGGGSALPNHDPEKRHDQLLVAQLEHMRAEFNEYMSRLDKINKRAKKLHKDLK